MNIEQAIEKFKHTNKWATFSDQTRRQYSYLLANSLDIDIEGVPLRNVEFNSVNAQLCSELYSQTSERGVTVANQTRTAFTALFTTLSGSNPFKGAVINAKGKRTVTLAHVQTFLTAAYSKFKWRNAGLLVQMVYELGQDMTDLVDLTWNDVDFMDEVVHVKGVALAMSADLLAVLEQQQEDFGFQQWVVPNPNIHTKDGFTPYGQSQLSRTLKKIREYAQLPDAFNMAEVKRLGYMAMLEDGYTLEEMEVVSQTDDRKEFKRTIDRLRADM